jgi:ribosomal protein S18 acetylase RimI-like enzyme
MKHIQIYSPQDQAAIKQFIIHILQEFDFHYDPANDYDLDDLAGYYARDKAVLYVLKEQEQIIGTVAVRNKEHGVAEIKRLFLHKSYRGQGWGSRLLDLALDFCLGAGYTKVILDTERRLQRSQELYLSRNFVITAIIGDTIYMSKDLRTSSCGD